MREIEKKTMGINSYRGITSEFKGIIVPKPIILQLFRQYKQDMHSKNINGIHQNTAHFLDQTKGRKSD
jgi:hypothetical protein